VVGADLFGELLADALEVADVVDGVELRDLLGVNVFEFDLARV
jgi:hypothetical protein